MIGDATLKPQVFGAEPTDLTLKNGEARFSTAPLTHRVTNVAKTTFRNITVEVLGSPGRAGDAPPLDTVPGHTLILQNDRVRVDRLILEPGQSTGMHSHNLAELGVVVSGGKLLIEPKDQKPQETQFKPGEFRWSEGARSHTIKNIGRTRFEAVTIEWK
jgi:quercetin dioxygenase-like cupin family protein